MLVEIRRLGRSIARWCDRIIARHRIHVSNGPIEAVNNLVNLVTRIKWVAFGMRDFALYRICSLLYAGELNWDSLGTNIPP